MVDQASEDEIHQLTRDLRDANAEVVEALSVIDEWRDRHRTLQLGNDGLSLQLQQAATDQQELIMAIQSADGQYGAATRFDQTLPSASREQLWPP